jgi:stage V sporulation protein AC
MAEEKKKVTVSQVKKEKNQQQRDKLYNEYVKQMTPKNNPVVNFFRAFISGGLICVLGQGFLNLFITNGLDKDTAALFTTVSLVFLAVLFTGLNWYQKLAKIAGAGSVVPITGFANSVAAPAIEFKKEGQVFGIGCKIFTIAGPVILYGIFSSGVLGLVYWCLKLLKV